MPACVSVTLLALAGAAFARNPFAAEAGAWPAFVDRFIEAHLEANPAFAVDAGRHEFDGRLPDWSRAGIEREIGRLRAAQDDAAAFDATALTAAQRFEREHLLALIDRRLFWLASALWPYRNPLFYADQLDPNVYVTRPYAPLAERMRAYVAYAKRVPEAARQIRENLRTPLPRSYVDVARISFGGLARYYEHDVKRVFGAVEDPGLQAEFAAANDAAAEAMRALDAWFATLEAEATEEFAIGAERFREMLRATERVVTPLEELERIGRGDMDRNLRALDDACARFAPGAPVAACIARAQDAKPAGGPVAAARRQLDDLRTFLVEADLVGIPGGTQAGVEESPPYKRWNAAYIDIPGPYDAGLPAVYYIAPPDPAWSAAEQAAYVPGRADLLFTSVHEVWPGHFLQFLHTNRLGSPLARLFVGYASAEGWAHYGEELMWEAGLGAGDPETHIGQLRNALLRNARFLAAIGLHRGTMTRAEAERLFESEAFQDPATARQQAARGTFDPAYLNYTLGKLMIRKLRDDWTASRGGRRAWRAFHDAFLGHGGAPIPLVRAAMLGPDAGPPL
jgi:hypothetical protein